MKHFCWAFCCISLFFFANPAFGQMRCPTDRCPNGRCPMPSLTSRIPEPIRIDGSAEQVNRDAMAGSPFVCRMPRQDAMVPPIEVRYVSDETGKYLSRISSGTVMDRHDVLDENGWHDWKWRDNRTNQTYSLKNQSGQSVLAPVGHSQWNPGPKIPAAADCRSCHKQISIVDCTVVPIAQYLGRIANAALSCPLEYQHWDGRSPKYPQSSPPVEILPPAPAPDGVEFGIPSPITSSPHRTDNCEQVRQELASVRSKLQALERKHGDDVTKLVSEIVARDEQIELLKKQMQDLSGEVIITVSPEQIPDE